MAVHPGRGADAQAWQRLAGRDYCDRWLWNGRYYVQRVQVKGLRAERRLRAQVRREPQEAQALFAREGPKYQYGNGCLTDGVLGAWHAQLYGLPAALAPSRTRRHLGAVFKHNFGGPCRAMPTRSGQATPSTTSRAPCCARGRREASRRSSPSTPTRCGRASSTRRPAT